MSIEKLTVENQQELEQMITNEINKVEKDLTVICSNVPINDRATLDILCHDNNGQLVVVQVSVNEDDVMFLQGIQSLNYVNKFKSFLKATYNKHKIDDKENPRLILVAPSFSDALRQAVESMKGMRIELYEWEYLKLGDHKGLRLQSIFAWTSAEKPTARLAEEKPPEKKREPKSLRKKEPEPLPEIREEPKPEPPEEIPAFTSPQPPEKAEEEKTFEAEPEQHPKRKLKLF